MVLNPNESFDYFNISKSTKKNSPVFCIVSQKSWILGDFLSIDVWGDACNENDMWRTHWLISRNSVKFHCSFTNSQKTVDRKFWHQIFIYCIFLICCIITFSSTTSAGLINILHQQCIERQLFANTFGYNNFIWRGFMFSACISGPKK